MLSWHRPSLISSKFADQGVASEAFQNVWTAWAEDLWHRNGLFPVHLVVSETAPRHVMWWGRGWHISFWGLFLLQCMGFCMCVCVCFGWGGGMHGVTVWSTNRCSHMWSNWNIHRRRQASLLQDVPAFLCRSLRFLLYLLFQVTGQADSITSEDRGMPTHLHTHIHPHIPSNVSNSPTRSSLIWT